MRHVRDRPGWYERHLVSRGEPDRAGQPPLQPGGPLGPRSERAWSSRGSSSSVAVSEEVRSCDLEPVVGEQLINERGLARDEGPLEVDLGCDEPRPVCRPPQPCRRPMPARGSRGSGTAPAVQRCPGAPPPPATRAAHPPARAKDGREAAAVNTHADRDDIDVWRPRSV
jgi:hypothetical protein